MVKLSRNANNSGNTEAFYVNANNTASNLNQNIGSQSDLFGFNLKDIKTLPLGKT